MFDRDNRKKIMSVKKQKEILFFYNLFTAGFMTWCMGLWFFLGPLKYRPIFFKISVIVWCILCVVFSCYLQYSVLICPVCKKPLRDKGFILTPYPKLCPECGSETE